jgi:microcystin-dependent protein
MSEYVGLVEILKRYRTLSIEELTDLLIPAGTVRLYAGIYIPSGWMICDGRLLSKAEYPKLYEALKDAWKMTWDTDSTKFRIPDMRECVAVGASLDATPDNKYNHNYVFDSTQRDPVTGTNGTQNHDAYLLSTFKDDQFQGHEHSYKNFEMRYGDDKETSAANEVEVVGALSTTAINNKSGYGNVRYGTTTHGKQVGLYYIIKY